MVVLLLPTLCSHKTNTIYVASAFLVFIEEYKKNQLYFYTLFVFFQRTPLILSFSLRCWVFGKVLQMFCLWMCCAVWLVAQEWFFMLTSPMWRYIASQKSIPSDVSNYSLWLELNRTVICIFLILLVVPAHRCLKCFLSGPSCESSWWCSL